MKVVSLSLVSYEQMFPVVKQVTRKAIFPFWWANIFLYDEQSLSQSESDETMNMWK